MCDSLNYPNDETSGELLEGYEGHSPDNGEKNVLNVILE